MGIKAKGMTPHSTFRADSAPPSGHEKTSLNAPASPRRGAKPYFGKRRTVSFGWKNDFGREGFQNAAKIPAFLI
jgi:hypothetical protein